MKAKDIIRQVCEERYVALVGVLGKNRRMVLCEARREISVRLKAANLSVPQIARMMKRDRTTINYHLLPRLRATKKARVEKLYGPSIRIRKQYVPALEKYAALTGASVAAAVNQAVSDMLESA